MVITEPSKKGKLSKSTVLNPRNWNIVDLCLCITLEIILLFHFPSHCSTFWRDGFIQITTSGQQITTSHSNLLEFDYLTSSNVIPNDEAKCI